MIFNSNWETLKLAMTFMQNEDGNFPIPRRVEFGPQIFALSKGSGGTTLPRDPLQQKTFAEFLQIVAPRIEELRLSVDSKCIINFKKSFYTSILEFPKLKSFELRFRNIIDESTRSFCYVYSVGEVVEHIFSTSPKLETVSIDWVIGYSQMGYYEDNYLKKLSPSLQSLTFHKNLMMPLTTNILSTLALPCLTSLNLDFNYASLSLGGRDALKVFSHYKDTLTSLTISSYVMKEIQFPIFPNLTTLDLEIIPDVRLINARDPNGFATLFPQVRDLKLYNMMSLQVLENLFPTGFLAPQVTSLVVPRRVDSEPEFTRLALGFPSLRKLVTLVPLAMETLPPIFEWMTGLEELHLHFNIDGRSQYTACADSKLTGIPENVLQSLGDESDLSRVDLMEVKSLPGLADMKCKLIYI